MLSINPRGCKNNELMWPRDHTEGPFTFFSFKHTNLDKWLNVPSIFKEPPKAAQTTLLHAWKAHRLKHVFTFVENANVMAEKRCKLHVKWRDFFSWLWMSSVRTSRNLLFHYPRKYHPTSWNSNWIGTKEMWFLSQISFLLLGTVPMLLPPSLDMSLL